MGSIIVILGLVVMGFLAIAFVIKPFIDSMMPTITGLGTPWEIALWGLFPILMLLLLIPLAVYRFRRRQ